MITEFFFINWQLLFKNLVNSLCKHRNDNEIEFDQIYFRAVLIGELVEIVRYQRPERCIEELDLLISPNVFCHAG